MRVSVMKPLFAWDCLEDNPALRTIREFLESVPDDKLLDALRLARGDGPRNKRCRTPRHSFVLCGAAKRAAIAAASLSPPYLCTGLGRSSDATEGT